MLPTKMSALRLSCCQIYVAMFPRFGFTCLSLL